MSDFDESDELTEEELAQFSADHGLVSRKAVDNFFEGAQGIIENAMDNPENQKKPEPAQSREEFRMRLEEKLQGENFNKDLWKKDSLGRLYRGPGVGLMPKKEEEKEKHEIPAKEDLREAFSKIMKRGFEEEG